MIFFHSPICMGYLKGKIMKTIDMARS